MSVVFEWVGEEGEREGVDISEKDVTHCGCGSIRVSIPGFKAR